MVHQQYPYPHDHRNWYPYPIRICKKLRISANIYPWIDIRAPLVMRAAALVCNFWHILEFVIFALAVN